jgi:cytochrome b561
MTRRGWLIAFHWVTALLVSASFAIAWLRKPVEDLVLRTFWLDVHRVIGLAVLALTLARLGLRTLEGPLSNRRDLSVTEWILSRAAHLMIYALLIAMPLLGWAQSSARARHFNLFGIPIPPLVHHDRDFAEVLGWWHEQLGWLLLGLIGVHALAALYHHYIRRDDVMRKMLPFRRRKRIAALRAVGEDRDPDVQTERPRRAA